MSTETKAWEKSLGSQHLYIKPKKRYSLVVFFMAFFVGVILAAVGLTIAANMSGLAKDSGISACEQIKKNSEAGTKSSGAKMTDQQRMDKRKPFANSKYADIRVAGTNLVDTTYQIDQKLDDANAIEAMSMATTVRTQYAALQTACSAHKVDIPNLPAA